MIRLKLVILLVINLNILMAQDNKAGSQAYIATEATVDTFVMPDEIYLSIQLSESSTKGKQSVQQLEQSMARELERLGIDLSKQLSLSDITGNYRDFIFKKDDVLQSKSFELLVHDAKTASQVIHQLSTIEITSVFVNKTEYSKLEDLMLTLRSKAVIKAKQQADAMLLPLGQTLGKAIFLSDIHSHAANTLRAVSAGVKIRNQYDFDTAKQEEILQIEFDEIQVEKTVSVKFLIE